MATDAWERQHEPRFGAILNAIRNAGEDLSVLDVGAAPYQLTNRILGLDNVYQVTALTLEREGAGTRKRLENGSVSVFTGNVEEAWPVGGKYDVIVMGAIIEHLFEPAFALHQARMCVSRGARLILSTPNGLSLKTRVETALGLDTPHDGFDIHATRYDRHQHEYSRNELENLLESVGWNVIETQAVNLSREGIAGRVYERVARGSLVDQWIVSAHAGRKRAGKPLVYRESVVNRE